MENPTYFLIITMAWGAGGGNQARIENHVSYSYTLSFGTFKQLSRGNGQEKYRIFTRTFVLIQKGFSALEALKNILIS